MSGLSGGERLQAALDAIATRVGAAAGVTEVRVGFLEGSTYPDGTSLPMVAAVQEFGATIQQAAGETTIYRKVTKGGEFANQGRFVKASKSNYATTHARGSYNITIPARPYFRAMIADNAPGWGKKIAGILKASNMDVRVTMAKMGDVIKGQLQTSIANLTSPPLARSTVRRKGFSKPLIDTGYMRQNVNYEVSP